MCSSHSDAGMIIIVIVMGIVDRIDSATICYMAIGHSKSSLWIYLPWIVISHVSLAAGSSMIT